MPDWRVTATTIYCDAVDDEVTIMIYRDWSSRCTGYDKYTVPDSDNLLKVKGKQSGRLLRCEGQQCHRVIQYKENLLSEEARKGH